MESVDGKKLRVARQGRGPALFLLHGYPDNLQIWSRLVPLLESRFEVFAFDWPGMGESEEWPGGTTPQDQAARIRRLMDHWQLTRVSLVGLDMGGQPALVFAAQFPDAIESVVVLNSLLYSDLPTSWEIGLLRHFGMNRAILRYLPRTVLSHAESTFLAGDHQLSPEVRTDFRDSFLRPEVRQFIVRLCAGYQGALPNLPAFYRTIRCPVYAVWGERERHFPVAHARELARQVPTCECSVISNGHHWLPWSHPAELAAFIGKGTRHFREA